MTGLCQGSAQCDLSVGPGRLTVSRAPGGVLVAHALGSCVAMALHDERNGVAGLAHIQLPNSKTHATRTNHEPAMYADLAVPALLKRAQSAGCDLKRARVILVGGAAILDASNFFQIGRKNILAVKRALWEGGLFIAAERLGGSDWRTLRVHVGTGLFQSQTHSGTEEL